MTSLLGFLFIYVLGGLTLIPLLLAAVLLHAYLTFPIHDDISKRTSHSDIVEEGDDVDAIKRVESSLAEKFQPRTNAEAETSSGYFYCSREYVERWWEVQGKPPERVTPVGSATVSAASPSVYQSMYRSIFERKPVGSPIENKGVGKPQKRGGNYFYIVLRHGHLMLFDDEEQLEVRHVVSLAHHSISCYSGGEETPEGELFIKRNALCLARRADAGEITPDGTPSKPFFLYSENCSAKEDFYFAMLRNQERNSSSKYNPPVPLQYDVKDIITLVQRLHSSEEQLQTRWINAVIGRVFLGLYKTPEVVNFLRQKITKKISRVKTPSFLSKISLRHLDTGEAAPVITNPRLKDLTVDGEMVVEFDVRYSGNFRIEVATTARIELGTRFKAREVNLLLAVLVKRVEGHAMVRIKPPPSNRMWITFSTMPKIDLQVEPIVSARQITYTLILRQIENRIKEVIAESLVFPNWDDSPFFSTEGKPWRGGIWTDNGDTVAPDDVEVAAAQEGDVDEVTSIEAHKADGEDTESLLDLPRIEKSMTAPNMEVPNGLHARKQAKSLFNLGGSKANASSTSVETRASAPEVPKSLRTGTFASISIPSVSTDATHADAVKMPSTPPEKSHAMAAVSALSQSPLQPSSRNTSPSRIPRAEKQGSLSSVSSEGSIHLEKEPGDDLTPLATHNMLDVTDGPNSYPSSPASVSNMSLTSDAPSIKAFGSDTRRADSTSTSSTKSTTSESTKRLSLAAVTNAAATAKTWGWNALQRQREQRSSNSAAEETTPTRPLVMGRGQPLPPPGVPLPHPEKKTKTAPIPVPKRKAIPPPNLQPKTEEKETKSGTPSPKHHAVPPPPLPKRREGQKESGSSGEEGVFVVAAPPADSEPTTPSIEHTSSYMPPWANDEEDESRRGKSSPIKSESHKPPRLPRRSTQSTINSQATAELEKEKEKEVEKERETEKEKEVEKKTEDPKTPPRLPKRRAPTRVMSSSPEEDSHYLPTWVAAQEDQARGRSSFVDEDAGYD